MVVARLRAARKKPLVRLGLAGDELLVREAHVLAVRYAPEAISGDPCAHHEIVSADYGVDIRPAIFMEVIVYLRSQ